VADGAVISSPLPASDTRVRVHLIALATLCTIGVAPSTMQALMWHESAGNP